MNIQELKQLKQKIASTINFKKSLNFTKDYNFTEVNIILDNYYYEYLKNKNIFMEALQKKINKKNNNNALTNKLEKAMAFLKNNMPNDAINEAHSHLTKKEISLLKKVYTSYNNYYDVTEYYKNHTRQQFKA